MLNRAVYVTESRHICLGEAEYPTCGPDDVIVKIEYCGICGSDVHFYSFGEEAFPDVYPFILGHECAGTIVEVGENVSRQRLGERVALEPGITCGKCEWCKGGKYNLCPHVKFLSAPRYQGAMRDYVAHPSELCFKLPEGMSTLEGALIEPLSVGLNAALNSGVTVGRSVAILGAGCIGLMTLLSLRAMGVENITVVDVFDNRLEKARELGAAHTINAKNCDAIQAVIDACGNGYGPDFVFETAGSMTTAAQTVYMAKRGGTIVMVGNTVGKTGYDFQRMVDKELQIKSVFRYRNTYPIAIEAISAGKIDVSSIISNIYPYEEAYQAFEDCIAKKMEIVKAVIRFGGGEKE